jgi:hypothetical protein
MRFGICVAFVTLLLSTQVSAQSWSFDARKIGMGGSSSDNLATEMVEDEKTYRSVVLPFGLFQVLSDFDIFKPGSDKFNIVRSMEYAASPLHYIVGRGTTASGEAFVTDVRNAELSRDLNRYRGFKPANELKASGLASPTIGRTIKFHERPDGTFHGVHIGAGPYLAMKDIGTIDPKLTEVLASATDVYLPNTQFVMTNSSQGQIALAVTGGYRGRFAWPTGVGGGSPREGLYVAADYNYLHGFNYQDAAMTVRLDTDGAGLVTARPGATPIAINYLTAKSGRGMAVDMGVSAVVSRWEFGFGANGIGNRITWTGVDQTTYTLNSLISGDSEFLESPKTRVADTRVELPIDYRGTVEYDADVWSAIGEIGRGFQGTSFHAGLERRYQRIDLRGGARFTNDKWNPTGGVGFNLSPHVSIDVAAFGTTANIERKRQLALAASIRLNRMQ